MWYVKLRTTDAQCHDLQRHVDKSKNPKRPPARKKRRTRRRGKSNRPRSPDITEALCDGARFLSVHARRHPGGCHGGGRFPHDTALKADRPRSPTCDLPRWWSAPHGNPDAHPSTSTSHPRRFYSLIRAAPTWCHSASKDTQKVWGSEKSYTTILGSLGASGGCHGSRILHRTQT